MLLAHWQYFKRCDLMTFNWAKTEHTALSSLEPYQVEFVKGIVNRIKGKRKSRLHFITGRAEWGSRK
jgi:hypothetical protein